MFNGTYPTAPFINHYDTVEDIDRRQHRIKLKVNGESHGGLLVIYTAFMFVQASGERNNQMLYLLRFNYSEKCT